MWRKVLQRRMVFFPPENNTVDVEQMFRDRPDESTYVFRFPFPFDRARLWSIHPEPPSRVGGVSLVLRESLKFARISYSKILFKITLHITRDSPVKFNNLPSR